MAVAADRYRPRSGRMCDNQVARKWWDASCLLQLDSACCRSDNISDGHAVPGGVPEQWYRSASVIHKDLATHQNGT